MPVPNKKTADAVQVCTSVVAAANCRPSVQYGGLLLNPGPRGPCPEQGVQRVFNVNVNSLHRGPNHGISTEEMFAK